MGYLFHKRKPIINTISGSIVAILFAVFFFSSCKKHNGAQPSKTDTTSTIGTNLAANDEDSLKYYVYQYMQVTITEGADTTTKIPQYYWYSQVPSLDPLSSSYPRAEDLLNTIISYPQNPQTGKAIDRYSFLDRTGAIAAQDLNGTSGTGIALHNNLAQANTINGDLGFEAGYAQDLSTGNVYLYVLYVYKNSSAGMQGVQRGWEITAINGSTDVTNTTVAENAIYNSASSSFTFKKPDGSSVTLNISATNYTLTPVLFDTVYSFNGIPVGYFVFKQFVDVYDNNGNPSETKKELDAVFNKFKTAGVKDVIVDLRYNTGGSVTTAEYLDSLLAPSTAAGNLMYTYKYNDKITQYINQLGFTQSVRFGNSTGGLNLNHLFFITDNLTASASELTMNNLKPYEDVKLVGDTTYGKPVGFFSWPIYDHDSTGKLQHLADLYDINYATFNSQNVGGYYNGIVPDFLDQNDYFNFNWGDLHDAELSDIYKYLTTGNFRKTANARLGNNIPVYQNTQLLRDPHAFVGMVNYSLSKKLLKQ